MHSIAVSHWHVSLLYCFLSYGDLASIPWLAKRIDDDTTVVLYYVLLRFARLMRPRRTRGCSLLRSIMFRMPHASIKDSGSFASDCMLRSMVDR